MKSDQSRIIELTEYDRKLLTTGELSEAAAKTLWDKYNSQIAVEPPSFKTDHRWQLTAQGWVGHIPLTPDLTFALQPKVPLGNLFHMLDYAYNLQSFRFLEGLVECQSLAEFYQRLAHHLAQRVLERKRKGFYRAYLPQTERLPYVRGRMDVRQSLQTPDQIKLPCDYEEHTADIEENQILAWTLFHIARSGMCTERVLPTVRRAYRALQGLVTLTPYSPRTCINRLYNRLNDDYRPLHALCRFFLEQSGPSHELGGRTMLPFLVDMARLYELFVAEWLKAHLPPNLTLKVQETVNISQTNALHFDIDLVLYETDSDVARWVLDTKYKTPEKPATEDIFQVMAYAEAKGCHEAILIYPASLPQPFDEMVGDIRVRSLTFSLDDDLEEAGETFKRALLE